LNVQSERTNTEGGFSCLSIVAVKSSLCPLMMILLKSFVLFGAVLFVSSQQVLLANEEKESEMLAASLKDLLMSVVSPNSKTINVIYSDVIIYQMEGLIFQIMKALECSIKYRLMSNLNDRMVEFNTQMETSIIIYKEWNTALLSELQLWANNDGIFILYLPAISIQLYLNIFDGFALKLFPNYLVLIDNGDFLELKMPAFYSRALCEKAYLQDINRFSKTSREWELPTFDLTSHMKFHGCPLRISILAAQPEIIHPAAMSTNFDEYSGYFADTIREIARRLDFTINVTEDHNDYDVMLLGTFTTFKQDDDFVTKYFTPIDRYIYFLVPLGDYYTGLEKLFLPYDDVGWILVVLTFAAGLVVIQVVLRLSKIKQNFIFGRRVTSPSMNLFVAFFGLGQTTLPGRNFARFILMMFILWCLIIRTAYQGVLYELLKSDGRKPAAINLDDFYKGNIHNTLVHVNAFCYQVFLFSSEFDR